MKNYGTILLDVIEEMDPSSISFARQVAETSNLVDDVVSVVAGDNTQKLIRYEAIKRFVSLATLFLDKDCPRLRDPAVLVKLSHECYRTDFLPEDLANVAICGHI